MTKKNNNTEPVKDGKDRPYQRESNGRFAKGNPGGPGGNQYTAPPKLLKDAIQKRLTSEKLEKIIDRLIGLATLGDKEAARLLFEHCYGKPIQRTEVDASVSASITVVRKTPRPKEGT